MTGNAKVRRGGKPGGRSGQVATHAQHDDISGGQQVDKMIINNRLHHHHQHSVCLQVQGAERDDGCGGQAESCSYCFLVYRLQQRQTRVHTGRDSI